MVVRAYSLCEYGTLSALLAFANTRLIARLFCLAAQYGVRAKKL